MFYQEKVLKRVEKMKNDNRSIMLGVVGCKADTNNGVIDMPELMGFIAR